jgi:methionyl-tRNA formyltransferase
MRVVFFGTPQFAVPSLEALIRQEDMAVVGVVTQPDKRRGRGGKVSPSPVKQGAIAAGLPVWQPRRIKKDPDTLAQLAALQADAFVVVAYGQILSPQILQMPRLGCINAHGSLLPAHRGAAPIQWGLYQCDTETGITTMQMDEGMDTGPMLLRQRHPIGLLDNAVTVAQALADLSGPLLIDTLQQLAAGTLTPAPQDDAAATYAPLIQKEDFRLDWSRSALALHNQVRGFYPNAVTQHQGTDLKVLETVPLVPSLRSHLPEDCQPLLDAVLDLPPQPPAPGTVAAILKSHGPVVQTGEGLLWLRQVKPTGKKAQSGWDFANGSRITGGDRLGEPTP